MPICLEGQNTWQDVAFCFGEEVGSNGKNVGGASTMAFLGIKAEVEGRCLCDAACTTAAGLLCTRQLANVQHVVVMVQRCSLESKFHRLVSC